MLEIINNLKPFFEDCYIELGVREYSRTVKISPPTASILLKNYTSKGILNQRSERKYLLFSINRESLIMKDLSRIYWRLKLKKLLKYLKEFSNPSAIILFGSLGKLEAKANSDIDLMLINPLKKNFNLDKFEKELGRKIQIFSYSSLEKINKELRMNIINGYVLEGYLL